MLLDIGTEEIGHVEMLATMIAHLLDKAPRLPNGRLRQRLPTVRYANEPQTLESLAFSK